MTYLEIQHLNNYEVYIKFFNDDRAYATSYQPLIKQKGYIWGAANTKDTWGSNVLSGVIPVDVGNNTASIIIKTGTTETTIISQTFIVSATNTQGYGLILSKTTGICPYEKIDAKIIVPSNGYLVTELVTQTTTNETKKYYINGSRSFPLSFTHAGQYRVYLTDNSGGALLQGIDSEIMYLITVDACVTPQKIPSADPLTQLGLIMGLITNPIAWAIGAIFISMVVVSWAVTQGKGDPTIPASMTGFVTLAGTTLLGWMPSWILFSVIFLILVAFAWQQATRTNTGGQ